MPYVFLSSVFLLCLTVPPLSPCKDPFAVKYIVNNLEYLCMYKLIDILTLTDYGCLLPSLQKGC
jgi:hypothetical protein